MSARYIQKAGLWIKEEHLPAVIGCDASGEIYALGEGVKGWSIGDKVYVQLMQQLRFSRLTLALQVLSERCGQ